MDKMIEQMLKNYTPPKYKKFGPIEIRYKNRSGCIKLLNVKNFSVYIYYGTEWGKCNFLPFSFYNCDYFRSFTIHFLGLCRLQFSYDKTKGKSYGLGFGG